MGDDQTYENVTADGSVDKFSLSAGRLSEFGKTAMAMPTCHESAKSSTNEAGKEGGYSATMSESQCKIVCAVLALACFDYPKSIELSTDIDSFMAHDEKSLLARIIPIDPNPPKTL